MLGIDIYEGGSQAAQIIFTGLGGETKGYQNKYQAISMNAVENHGATAFVVGTPKDVWKPGNPHRFIQESMQYVDNYMKVIGHNEYDVRAGGHSAGGTILAWYAHEYPAITKVVTVNSVLGINLHWMKAGLTNFAGESIKTIFGEFDQSAIFAPLLDDVDNERYERKMIPGANHGFDGMLSEFVSLFDQHLWG